MIHRVHVLPRERHIAPIHAALLLCWFACSACSMHVPAARSLIEPHRWELGSERDDPFTDRPETVVCPSWSFGEEDGLFEIQTDGCRYGTFVQPLLQTVLAHGSLALRFEHLGLFSQLPGQAHVALSVDGVVLWQTEIPIPSEQALYVVEIPLQRTFAEGSPVVFHLHNHGSNTWRILGLDVL